MRDPVVIVGAGIAGSTAAMELRGQGVDESIILVGDERHDPYDRPPLSKQLLLATATPDDLRLRSGAELRAASIEWLPGVRASDLDVGARRVRVAGSWIKYSSLIIATGLRSRQVEAAGSPPIPTLRTLDDAVHIAERMAASSTAVIVGGGLLAYELACSFSSAGLTVTVVDPAAIPLERAIGPVAGHAVEGLHKQQGVEILHSTRACSFSRDGLTTRVLLNEDRQVAGELIVLAVGSRPATAWLRGSGVGDVDGVLCDARGRAAPHVFAIGDVSRWPVPGRGQIRRELRSNATDQAAAVARVIAGRPVEPLSLPFLWSEQHGSRLQMVGDWAREADTSVIAGDPSTGRFVLEFRRSGNAVGVLGFGMPKDFAAARRNLLAADTAPHQH